MEPPKRIFPFLPHLSGFPLGPEVDKGDEMGRRLVDWALPVKSSKWDQILSGNKKGSSFFSNPTVQYIKTLWYCIVRSYFYMLKFFTVGSLTNQREFYFAGCDGSRGSNPPKWNKMEQSIDRLSAFIPFWL